MARTDTMTLVSPRIRAGLRCPTCYAQLRDEGHYLVCAGMCRTRFPVVDRVPVLIDEARSIFNINDFVEHRATFFSPRSAWHRRAARLMPELGRNFTSKSNFTQFRDLLTESVAQPVVLVIGAGEEGNGIGALTAQSAIEVVNSDVSLTGATDVVCDAHRLPFDTGLFDGVVAQAVLEHVLDPVQCAEEIHRVLKPGGLIYAETPFMQPVHGGRYDFTRFTFLGHRRLFCHFEQIAAGPGGGPASAFAWSYEYFLLSILAFERTRFAVKAFARLSAFWLKYIDLLIQNRPRSMDAAWGFYFLGRRSDKFLSDRELVALYPPGARALNTTNK